MFFFDKETMLLRSYKIHNAFLCLHFIKHQFVYIEKNYKPLLKVLL